MAHQGLIHVGCRWPTASTFPEKGLDDCPILFIIAHAARHLEAGRRHLFGRESMTRFVSALAFGLVIALAVPASAQTPPAKPPAATPAAEAPKTKADCEKVKDMKWDEKDKKCVKAEAKK